MLGSFFAQYVFQEGPPPPPKKQLTIWAQLLEAWLALTSV